jgi:hypothetical protein
MILNPGDNAGNGAGGNVEERGRESHLHTEDSLIPIKRYLGILDPTYQLYFILFIPRPWKVGERKRSRNTPEHGMVEDISRRV